MLELLSGKKFSIISEYPKYFDKPEYEKGINSVKDKQMNWLLAINDLFL